MSSSRASSRGVLVPTQRTRTPAKGKRTIQHYGVNTPQPVVKQERPTTPAEVRAKDMEAALLRAKQRQKRLQPRVNEHGHIIGHRQSFRSSSTGWTAPATSTSRLLKMHALGPHDEWERTRLDEPLSSDATELLNNTSTFLATHAPQISNPPEMGMDEFITRVPRSRKRISTAEWARRSTEVKTAELSAGKRSAAPKRPWDTRQAKHAFATEFGQTTHAMARARDRNTVWTENQGLLEPDSKIEACVKRSQPRFTSAAHGHTATSTGTLLHPASRVPAGAQAPQQRPLSSGGSSISRTPARATTPQPTASSSRPRKQKQDPYDPTSNRLSIKMGANGYSSASCRRPSTAGSVAGSEASSDSFGPSFRAWIAMDKAHNQFMVSINREKVVRQQAEKVEESRRESVWQDFERGAILEKFDQEQEARDLEQRAEGGFEYSSGITGVLETPEKSARQFFLRREDEPVDEDCDRRAGELLNRSHASNVGYGYDHQGYMGI